MNNKKLAVIYCDERDWKTLEDLFPHDMELFHKVSRIDQTIGMNFSNVVTLGRAHMISGYDEIYFEVKRRIR